MPIPGAGQVAARSGSVGCVKLPTTCQSCENEVETGEIVGLVMFLNWAADDDAAKWTTLKRAHLASAPWPDRLGRALHDVPRA